MKYSGYVLILFFLLSACGEKKFDNKTYEQHKESLAEKEQKNPLHFLSVSGDHKKNLIGQTVVSGTIHNRASVVSYKDVRIKMLCYKSNAMVEEHEDRVDDIIKPGAEREFKIKYRLPKGTDSIALSLMSASVAEPDAKKK